MTETVSDSTTRHTYMTRNNVLVDDLYTGIKFSYFIIVLLLTGRFIIGIIGIYHYKIGRT